MFRILGVYGAVKQDSSKALYEGVAGRVGGSWVVVGGVRSRVARLATHSRDLWEQVASQKKQEHKAWSRDLLLMI